MKVALVNPPPAFVQEPMYDRPTFVRPALAAMGATLREAGAEVELIAWAVREHNRAPL